MPVTKSAQKALRQERKRTTINRSIKSRAQSAITAARQDPTTETIRQACSALDKAVKKHVVKKGKADRLKSRLSRLFERGKTSQVKTTKKVKSVPKKKASKKTTPKKTATDKKKS